MENTAFLNVKQVAAYIHLNEKKVYALVAEGAIPATKVTGKWIFPRELIDRWLLESSHGGLLNDRLVINGCADPLLNRAALRLAQRMGSAASVSYTTISTRHGLEQLQARRADVAVMRWGRDTDSLTHHTALLQQYPRHRDWILLQALRRERGLMLTPPVARQFAGVAELLQARVRWAMRQSGSGGQRYLLEVLAQHDRNASDLQTSVVALSEHEAAAAISMDLADVAAGSRAAAAESGLGFISLGWESVDLVLAKPVWFRHLFQAMLQELQSPESLRMAAELEGYDLSESGKLRWSLE